MSNSGIVSTEVQNQEQPAAIDALMDAMLVDSAGSEHPDTNLPFKAVIDGRQFNGKALSLTSAVVSGLAAADFCDNGRLAKFSFPFSNFAISIVAEVKITALDAATGEYRLDFLRPTGEHLPTLRYLLNSYISGDVVSLGSVISQRDQAAAPNVAKTQPKLSFAARLAILGRSLVTLAFASLLVVIFSSLVYDRLFTSKVDELAVLTQGGEPLRALEAGQVNYLNGSAGVGEVLYSLQNSKLETVSVTNPCNCRVNFTAIAIGSTILAGETVAELVRLDSIPSVIVNLTSEEARRLLSGDVAEITLPGGKVLLDHQEMSITRLTNSEKVRASFELQFNFDDLESGTPASVRIVNGTFASIYKRLVKIGFVSSPHQFTQQKQKEKKELGNETDTSINTERWGGNTVVAPLQNRAPQAVSAD